jgi:hypothetical protein
MMSIPGQTANRIALPVAAQQVKLTSQGLLKILQRTGNTIRDDGRWYVDPEVVDRIIAARQTLGLAADRSRG